MPGNISLLGDLVPKCLPGAAWGEEDLDYTVTAPLPLPAPHLRGQSPAGTGIVSPTLWLSSGLC